MLYEEVLRNADTRLWMDDDAYCHRTTQAMSEEQLSALLAKLKEDAGLREKLKGATDLDAALALANKAGFDITKTDWLKYQTKQTLELSDEELERVAGGKFTDTLTGDNPACCGRTNGELAC